MYFPDGLDSKWKARHVPFWSIVLQFDGDVDGQYRKSGAGLERNIKTQMVRKLFDGLLEPRSSLVNNGVVFIGETTDDCPSLQVISSMVDRFCAETTRWKIFIESI